MSKSKPKFAKAYETDPQFREFCAIFIGHAALNDLEAAKRHADDEAKRNAHLLAVANGEEPYPDLKRKRAAHPNILTGGLRSLIGKMEQRSEDTLPPIPQRDPFGNKDHFAYQIRLFHEYATAMAIGFERTAAEDITVLTKALEVLRAATGASVLSDLDMSAEDCDRALDKKRDADGRPIRRIDMMMLPDQKAEYASMTAQGRIARLTSIARDENVRAMLAHEITLWAAGSGKKMTLDRSGQLIDISSELQELCEHAFASYAGYQAPLVTHGTGIQPRNSDLYRPPAEMVAEIVVMTFAAFIRQPRNILPIPDIQYPDGDPRQANSDFSDAMRSKFAEYITTPRSKREIPLILPAFDAMQPLPDTISAYLKTENVHPRDLLALMQAQGLAEVQGNIRWDESLDERSASRSDRGRGRKRLDETTMGAGTAENGALLTDFHRGVDKATIVFRNETLARVFREKVSGDLAASLNLQTRAQEVTTNILLLQMIHDITTKDPIPHASGYATIILEACASGDSYGRRLMEAINDAARAVEQEIGFGSDVQSSPRPAGGGN